MSPLRKAILTVAALLVGCGLALFNLGFFNPNAPSPRLSDWTTPWRSVEGGPQFVLEVDPKALRRSSHEMLRDRVREELRAQRVGLVIPPLIRDDIVQVRVSDKDRQRALERLPNLPGQQPEWLEIREDDGGLIKIAFSEARLAEQMRQAADRAALNIETRLSSLGGFRVSVRRQGDTHILVQVSRTDDLQSLIALATRPGVLEFRLLSQEMTPEQALTWRPPPDAEVLYGRPKNGKQPYLVEKRVVVSGRDLSDAQPAFDARTSEPIVTFRFNASGARRFAQATMENVGRPFAIVLDGEVLSAPVIREPILGGAGQISGSFTVQSANELAITLRGGELPARLNLIEERPASP
jgi:preprotein translocase subunit SecD